MIREAVLFCLGVAMWAEDDEGDDGIVSGCGSGTAGGRAGGVEDVRLWTVEEFLVAMGVVGCVPELVIAVVSSSQSSSQYKLSGDERWHTAVGFFGDQQTCPGCDRP